MFEKSEVKVWKCCNYGNKYLEQIVRIDEKGRYSFNEDKTLIRANQGHSIQYIVQAEEMYKDGYKFYLSKNGV